MCEKKEFHQTYVLDLVEVFGCVLIGHVSGTDVEFEVRSIVLEIVVVGKFWVQEGRGEMEGKKAIKRGGKGIMVGREAQENV